MDEGIAAIANPVRRQMLALVRDRERTPSDIADEARLTRPATSQHLRVLRDAGLVVYRADGGRRFYRADERRLDALRAYLESFWSARVADLKREAETAR